MICGKEFLFINGFHLRKHNITTKQYKILYPYAPISSEERNLKISCGNMGRKAWSKGLTKETHHSLLMSSIKHKGQKPWHTGLTKETDSRVLQLSKSVQKSVQEYYNNGGESWLKGLTKDTDERVKKIAERFVGHSPTEEQRQEIRVGVRKAWERGDFVNVRPMGGGVESIYHKSKKEFVAKLLNEIGFNVELERFVTINGKSYAVDILAKNDREKIVVEIGSCDKLKEEALQSYCDRYFHIPYYDEKKCKYII